MVCSAVRASICLGRAGVDIGHSRVPDPPERMTGTIDAATVMQATPVGHGDSRWRSAWKPLWRRDDPSRSTFVCQFLRQPVASVGIAYSPEAEPGPTRAASR